MKFDEWLKLHPEASRRQAWEAGARDALGSPEVRHAIVAALRKASSLIGGLFAEEVAQRAGKKRIGR